MADDYDSIILQVAGRDLPANAQEDAAIGLIMAREKFPQTKISLWADGYDDDPRELWDIPEVCEQIRGVFGLVFIARPEWKIEDLNLEAESVTMLLLCSGTVEVVSHNPETNTYEVRPKAKQPDRSA